MGKDDRVSQGYRSFVYMHGRSEHQTVEKPLVQCRSGIDSLCFRGSQDLELGDLAFVQADFEPPEVLKEDGYDSLASSARISIRR